MANRPIAPPATWKHSAPCEPLTAVYDGAIFSNCKHSGALNKQDGLLGLRSGSMTKLVTSATLALSLLAAISPARLIGQDTPRSRYAARARLHEIRKRSPHMRRRIAKSPLPRVESSSSARRRSGSGKRSPPISLITRLSTAASAARRSSIPPTSPTASSSRTSPSRSSSAPGATTSTPGESPREVAADFAEFVRVVHARLPRTEILYIAVSPAPARWGEADKNRELNRLIRETCPGYAARRLRGCLRHQPHPRRPCPTRAVRQGQAPLRRRGLQAARRPRPPVPGGIRAARSREAIAWKGIDPPLRCSNAYLGLALYP